jgi:hypothetical protein
MSVPSDSEEATIAALRRANKKLVTRTLLIIASIVLLLFGGVGIVAFMEGRQQKPKPVLTEIAGYHKESEVMASITLGMPLQAVIKIYGEPSMSLDGADGETRHFWHAPDPDPRFAYEGAFAGFSVIEKNEKVIWKGSSYMDVK